MDSKTEIIMKTLKNRFIYFTKTPSLSHKEYIFGYLFPIQKQREFLTLTLMLEITTHYLLYTEDEHVHIYSCKLNFDYYFSQKSFTLKNIKYLYTNNLALLNKKEKLMNDDIEYFLRCYLYENGYNSF